LSFNCAGCIEHLRFNSWHCVAQRLLQVGEEDFEIPFGDTF
jgi:hypothetical protein